MSDAATDLGRMPEWDLNDLYPGTKSPELTSGLVKAASDAEKFKKDWQGKLEEIAAGEGGGQKLADIIKSYEAMGDLIGRIGSYAGLLYAGNNEDPVTAKFYGDTQEKLTNIYNNLLFFELEFNRIER